MWQIKPDYHHRESVEPFPDQETERIFQPHIYEFAKYLCERLNSRYLIDIGCGNGVKVMDFPEGAQKIGIDYGPNLEVFETNNPGSTVISINLENESPALDDEVIENSVVICADVIEHLQDPSNFLKYLSKLSRLAQFVIVSTPDRTRIRGIGDYGPPKNPWHFREWSSEELNSLFRSFTFKEGFWGHSVNNNEQLEKSTTVYIGGRMNGFETAGTADLKAVAIMSVYNEKDIAVASIQHHLDQGLYVHIVDNWSNNGTFNKIKQVFSDDERVTVERFPREGKSDQYKWKEILTHKREYALTTDFHWAIHVDADELRISPWENVSLLDGIKIVDALGFNAIDFTVCDYRPIKPGYQAGINPKFFFTHFEYPKMPGAFLRINAWKVDQKKNYDLESSGGHHIQFMNQRVYPIKFVMKHYPYRSLSQIKSKIFDFRLPRIEEEFTKYNWHTHLIDFSYSHGVKLWDTKTLLNDSLFTRDNHLIERLSGVGLPREIKTRKEYLEMFEILKKSGSNPTGLTGIEMLMDEIDRLSAEVEALRQDRN